MSDMPRFRGAVPITEHRVPGSVRCRWGPCEAGGWIMPNAPRFTDEYGGPYHRGCRTAMEYANRPCSSSTPATVADGDEKNGWPP